MEGERIEIWPSSGIALSQAWRNANTSVFDDLAPSWYAKRENLIEPSDAYAEFFEQMKRQHAIETGVIEKLYDLSEGVTQTLITEGFVESFLSHGDSNISSHLLMNYLKDHAQAIEFVFDLVKNRRELSIGFVKELHALVARSQQETEAIDQFGKMHKIPLLHGQFKQHENNPIRADGTVIVYCPPVHVDAEMEKLIKLYQAHSDLHPICLASWFHHAFTQIHPFQDGNGRVARLLSTLILIQKELFPFTVHRTQRADYIRALEKADEQSPQDLVSFFALNQKRNIEAVANLRPAVSSAASLDEVVELFSKKVAQRSLESRETDERLERLEKNRELVRGWVKSFLNEMIEKIKSHELTRDSISFISEREHPISGGWQHHINQIKRHAQNQGYSINETIPMYWVAKSFQLPNQIYYDLFISIHHYGHDDNVIAVAAILDRTSKDKRESFSLTQLEIPVATFSIEDISESSTQTKENMRMLVEQIVSVALGVMIHEMG